MAKKITLDELGVSSQQNASTPTPTTGQDRGAERVTPEKKIQKVNISDFVKVKPKISPQEKAKKELLDQVDEAIERTKKELTEKVIEPFKEACIAASLSDESDALNPNKDLEAEFDSIADPEIRAKTRNTTDQDLIDLMATDDEDDFNPEFDETIPAKTVADVKPATFMEDPDDLSPDALEDEKEDIDEPNFEEEEAIMEETKEIKAPVIEENIKAPEIKGEENEEKKEDLKAETTVEVEATPMVSAPKEVVEAVSKPANSNGQETISDDDLKEFLDEEGEELTEDEKEELKARQKEFRKEVFEKLNIPATVDKTGISKFRIATKPVSVNKILKVASTKLESATWVLPNSGRLATYSALSGEEIENLNPDAHDSNISTEMANRLVFGTMFSHLVDANKPETMEEWLKTINWFDINDIYFGIYLATFKNSNFVAYSCDKDKCKKIFLKDTKYQDMIKYADEKCEKAYKTLLSKGIDVTPSEIPEDIVPISPTYAIGFRAPSVYDIIFGASSLDARFRAKYATTIGNISYMANIYYIQNDTLFPVDCKPVKDDPSRTMRNKIVAYYNILKTLSSDQFSVVTRTINEINEQNKVMATFHYPDAVCPNCGAEIKRADEEMNPLTMLFIRHQLVQSASSMTE